jgi:hypothetical protein
MKMFQAHPDLIFPFSLGSCKTIVKNEVCHLDVAPVAAADAPVRVTSVTATSFTFTTLKGHVDPVGSTVTFTVYQSGGDVYFRQTAWWNTNDPVDLAKAYGTVPAAFLQWQRQSDNLRMYAYTEEWIDSFGIPDCY